LEKEKSSEPNHHDFRFKLLIFEGVYLSYLYAHMILGIPGMSSSKRTFFPNLSNPNSKPKPLEIPMVGFEDESLAGPAFFLVVQLQGV